MSIERWDRSINQVNKVIFKQRIFSTTNKKTKQVEVIFLEGYFQTPPGYGVALGKGLRMSSITSQDPLSPTPDSKPSILGTKKCSGCDWFERPASGLEVEMVEA